MMMQKVYDAKLLSSCSKNVIGFCFSRNKYFGGKIRFWEALNSITKLSCIEFIEKFEQIRFALKKLHDSGCDSDKLLSSPKLLLLTKDNLFETDITEGAFD